MRARTKILAGRMYDATAAEGPKVCACFGVTRDAIRHAIVTHRLGSVQQIGVLLHAVPIAVPAFLNSRRSCAMFACPRNDAIGSATLVGAGPGDPDLLTLRAVKAIQRADAVLYNSLIDPSILELARPDARRIDVGKRCGRHAMNQAAINSLIVKLAQAGAHVVRLKGGDPFIFGRGGEELDSLRAAGVPVEVVPGITAACAAAASLRIPLTHRGVARSLHFVTGHGRDGDVAAHDWCGLAASGGTIAAYMASKTLRSVAASLIEAGLPGSTPAVAVENASRSNETHLYGTLSSLPGLLEANRPDGPTLVLIGAVVALARSLREGARLAA